MFKSILLKLFGKNEQEKLKPDIGIEITETRMREDAPPITAEEILFKKAFLVKIKEALSRYDFIKKDKLEFLAKRILDGSYNQGEVLSLQDKKSLNLNTRAKYSKELIECFLSVETLKFDPKDFCRNLQYTERSIVWTTREINRLKQVGFIDEVRLSGIGDVGDWDERIVKIDKIPPFPIIDYTKEQGLFFINGHINPFDSTDF